MFANYLQRNALAGRAGERGEPLDGPAGDEGLVAPVNLGHSLLDQRNPKLIAFRLKERMAFLYITSLPLSAMQRLSHLTSVK